MTISIGISLLVLTVGLINGYRNYSNTVGGDRQIDTTRVHEGLPTDMALTPEDFRANPELAEIFGIADTDNNLDVILESNEHFEQVQNDQLVQDQLAQNQLIQDQLAQDPFSPIDVNYLLSIYEAMEAYISNFF
jgi:hypothetical protein